MKNPKKFWNWLDVKNEAEVPEELGGDKYMVNGNMVDLSNVGATYVK